MSSEDLLKNIRNISQVVASSEINALQLEEKMLHELVANPSIGMRIKAEAFKIIRAINLRQNQLLGN